MGSEKTVLNIISVCLKKIQNRFGRILWKAIFIGSWKWFLKRFQIFIVWRCLGSHLPWVWAWYTKFEKLENDPGIIHVCALYVLWEFWVGNRNMNIVHRIVYFTCVFTTWNAWFWKIIRQSQRHIKAARSRQAFPDMVHSRDFAWMSLGHSGSKKGLQAGG